MRHIRYSIVLLALISLHASALAGCGGGDTSPLVTPEAETSDIQPNEEVAFTGSQAADATTDITQWGTWVIHCEDATDDNPASVEAVPLRAGDLHLDVTSMLLPPTCTNCFDVSLMGITGNEWTLYVELTNPTVYTAYDVMGVFPGSDGPAVLLPTSHTDLYDIDGDTSTHNPFIIIETGNERNAWGPAETHGQMISFNKEEGQSFADLLYVVAVSWPDNQEEVTEITNTQASGPLYTDASSPVTITVEIRDWQENVEDVIINMTPVNGNPSTHMASIGNGEYQLYSYAAYGLSQGTTELEIAAKSYDSDYWTYNYMTIQITDPVPDPSNFQVFAGPTLLENPGAPSGEKDLTVTGRSDGTSSTFVFSSDTEIYEWNEDYTQAGLFLTLTDSTGTDPDFPIQPVSRLAVTDPDQPLSPDTFSFLITNEDPGTWDDLTNPVILYSNLLQVVDLEELQVVDFTLTTDNIDTEELEAILRPADVASGFGNDKFGYALWVPDGGEFPQYYPYVTLMRYEPPYKDVTTEYDTLIGGVNEGSGEGNLAAEDITGLAVWDGTGPGGLLIVVSEGGSTGEVEIFSTDYLTNPGGEFTSVATLTGFVGTPVDVCILPVGDAGEEAENWICILTDSRTIELYTESGSFIESILDVDMMPSIPSHLAVDDVNLRIHVMMDGPRVTVFEYTGM